VTFTQKSKDRRLLVVEDDEILLGFLDKYLSKNNYETKCLSEGGELPSILEKQRYHLVILDLMLPGKNGIYWLKWLRRYHPYIPVIIISSKSNEDDRLFGLENGAHDYIIKPFREGELLIRMENVLRSMPYFHRPKSVVKIGDITLDMDKNSVFREGDEVKLTVLEASILKLLYLNAGATLTRDDITEQIRGAKHHPLDRSIDIHINKLRKKIEENPSNPAFIRTIRGKGYSFQMPEGATLGGA
jgi:DNA-binding response OmpR family regulator